MGFCVHRLRVGGKNDIVIYHGVVDERGTKTLPRSLLDNGDWYLLVGYITGSELRPQGKQHKYCTWYTDTLQTGQNSKHELKTIKMNQSSKERREKSLYSSYHYVESDVKWSGLMDGHVWVFSELRIWPLGGAHPLSKRRYCHNSVELSHHCCVCLSSLVFVQIWDVFYLFSFFFFFPIIDYAQTTCAWRDH